MEQPSAFYRLFQASMELDWDNGRGGGRRRADVALALQALTLPPKRQQSDSPPGYRETLHQPPTAPGPEATGSQEGGGGCTSPPCPKARPAPTATKSGPPQPPEVLAATNKAKPAQAKALEGPKEVASRPTAQRPPQEELASESYSYSGSQSSEAAPQGKKKQESLQRVPRKDERALQASGPPGARAGPGPPPREEERRAQVWPASPQRAAPRTHRQQAPRRGRAKASLVLCVSSPDPSESPRRRRGDSPGAGRRRRYCHSASRSVQTRRGDSRSSRSCHARRYANWDSRSLSGHRHRSRSRRGGRSREAPRRPLARASGNVQSLQEGRRRAGQGHTQEASHPGKMGLQDRRQAHGPTRPGLIGSLTAAVAALSATTYGQGGKHGKSKGPPQAPGKGRRGQGSKGKHPQGACRKAPETEGQHKNANRRKERTAYRFGRAAAAIRDGLREEERPGKAKGGHAEQGKQQGKEGAESGAKAWFD